MHYGVKERILYPCLQKHSPVVKFNFLNYNESQDLQSYSLFPSQVKLKNLKN